MLVFLFVVLRWRGLLVSMLRVRGSESTTEELFWSSLCSREVIQWSIAASRWLGREEGGGRCDTPEDTNS